MGRGRSQRGVGGIRQRNLDSFVEFIQGVVDDGNGDILVSHSRGEGQRSASQGVVHATARGCATGDRIIHGHRMGRGPREGDRQIGGSDRLGAA